MIRKHITKSSQNIFFHDNLYRNAKNYASKFVIECNILLKLYMRTGRKFLHGEILLLG